MSIAVCKTYDLKRKKKPNPERGWEHMDKFYVGFAHGVN